jgi:MFS family permease
MALSAQSFALFIVATMLFGINFAFTHQYRYAAAESVPPRYTARAVSFVLLGAIGGALIERAGVTRMMMLGALSLLLTSVVGLQGQSVLHYWWALVLLGVGWNFMYVGATTMLTYTYSMSERFRAQAINEFLVFGTAAAASLLAATIVHYFGWLRLMLVPLPLLLVVCAALLLVRRDPLLRTVESV